MSDRRIDVRMAGRPGGEPGFVARLLVLSSLLLVGAGPVTAQAPAARASQEEADAGAAAGRPAGTVSAPLTVRPADPAAAGDGAEAADANGGPEAATENAREAGAAAENAGGSADGPVPFDIWEYRVLGNSVLDAKRIERTLYPFLGPDRTDAAVKEARAALEQAYRDAGYFTALVTIPEQNVDPDAGIVRLQVTEGRVDRLHVTGARWFSNRRIAEQVPSLQPGALPTTEGFREDLTLLAARSPDRTVQPLARPGRYPGTVEFELTVDDRRPFHFAVEVNDRFTIGTSRPRLTFNASYDNLFQREHSLRLSYQTTPLEDEVDAYSATYQFRPARSRRTFSLYYLENASDITTVGGDLTLGAGRTIGLRALQPLPARGAFNHLLNANVAYKDFSDEVAPAGAAPSEDNLVTALDYIVFSTQYQGNWRGGSAAQGAPRPFTSFGLGVFLGVRALGNDSVEFDNKRFGADPNFVYARGDFTRTTPLTDTLGLVTRLSGQVTSQPLVANEQFALGGFNTVRGYLLAEQLVDYGAVASVEMRWTPALFADSRLLRRLSLYPFADWGAGKLFDTLPEQQSDVDLASVGLGFRAVGARGATSVAFDWAYALRDASVSGGEFGNTQGGDSRVHFSVRYDF